MKELTIIISFLNEKEEVENTLKSIFDTADSNLIDVIVINDASDDGFDYDFIKEKFPVTYYKLTKRLGIARCRDYAIEKCKTKFFLLLDAHMRFYDRIWAKRIIETLSKNERILLCCDNKALQYVDGEVKEVHKVNYYGAIINFYDKKNAQLLSPLWNTKRTINYLSSNLYKIPCVLGAAYACSKKYWTYLNGLHGLELYGFDEPYISLKVWLEGGMCLLDKNICVGHIYRTEERPVPYSFQPVHYYYNCLLVSTLLLPDELRNYIFNDMKISRPLFYNESLYKLYENKDKILSLKKEYKQKIKHDFFTFESFNNSNIFFKSWIKKTEKKLEQIANFIVYHHYKLTDIGLYEGKLSIALYLYQYSIFSKQASYKNIADLILDEVVSSIDENYSFNLYSGYCGIGLGLIYLTNKSCLSEDINIVLKEIDKKVEGVNISAIQDINLFYGLGGISLYVLLRLYMSKDKNPFNHFFLEQLYKKVKDIINTRVIKCDSIDIYIKLILYIDEKMVFPIYLTDLIFLDIPKRISLEKQKLGLHGLSGIGIKLLSEYKYMRSFSYDIIYK